MTGPFLDTAAAAHYIGASAWWIRQEAKAGRLRYFLVGDRYRFRRDD